MSHRFTALGDGWHTDSTTGLEWSATAADRMNHAAADAWCVAEGGRLPTISELTALLDYELNAPCTSLPDSCCSYYWSATAYVPDAASAWVVDCSDGGVHAFTKGANLFVRAVRAAA